MDLHMEQAVQVVHLRQELEAIKVLMVESA
jgi:hypothetical protein